MARQTVSEQRTRTRRLEITVASQRKKQIIEAAKECITEEGLERLSLRKVAERAAVSHATIAYYFHTRRELVDAALLEISEAFMTALRQRRLRYGTQDLVELVHTFLDPENDSARFVVQMIDSGLHDAYLRGKHDEFVRYGRERIERSFRVGMERGELRADIDPRVAAGLLHTVLIFWQAELVAGTATREQALEVGELVLRLLARGNEITPERASRTSSGNEQGNGARRPLTPGPATPTEVIAASLMDDPRLSAETARALTSTFIQIYELAVGREAATTPARNGDTPRAAEGSQA